ncbi:unnamed protein product [Rotaria magnacalcarata]|uniref:Uncharacterized protein n=1 Tax=Rotaria magnacalcarata TaxID=392030 RepID=A0A8S2MP24_9BILA|nr:unnamed protein product [Rotaria magnacalcarata]CAF3964825.1 unnamed protein product [Rotaria magnacalcarata]
MATVVGLPPYRLHILPDIEQDEQQLLILKEKFSQIIHSENRRLDDTEKLNSNEMNIGVMLLTQDILSQYNEYLKQYQGTGLEIRSAEIANFKISINRIINEHRFSRQLAVVQRRMEVLADKPKEDLSKLILDGQNVKITKEILNKQEWRLFKMGNCIVDRCFIQKFNQKPKEGSLLKIGNEFLLQLRKMLSSSQEHTIDLNDISNFIQTYLYNSQQTNYDLDNLKELTKQRQDLYKLIIEFPSLEDTSTLNLLIGFYKEKSVAPDQKSKLDELENSCDMHRLINFHSSKKYEKVEMTYTIEQQIDAFNTLYDPALAEEILNKCSTDPKINRLPENKKGIEFINWITNSRQKFDDKSKRNIVRIVGNILRETTSEDIRYTLEFLRIVFLIMKLLNEILGDLSRETPTKIDQALKNLVTSNPELSNQDKKEVEDAIENYKKNLKETIDYLKITKEILDRQLCKNAIFTKKNIVLTILEKLFSNLEHIHDDIRFLVAKKLNKIYANHNDTLFNVTLSDKELIEQSKFCLFTSLEDEFEQLFIHKTRLDNAETVLSNLAGEIVDIFNLCELVPNEHMDNSLEKIIKRLNTKENIDHAQFQVILLHTLLQREKPLGVLDDQLICFLDWLIEILSKYDFTDKIETIDIEFENLSQLKELCSNAHKYCEDSSRKNLYAYQYFNQAIDTVFYEMKVIYIEKYVKVLYEKHSNAIWLEIIIYFPEFFEIDNEELLNLIEKKQYLLDDNEVNKIQNFIFNRIALLQEENIKKAFENFHGFANREQDSFKEKHPSEVLIFNNLIDTFNERLEIDPGLLIGIDILVKVQNCLSCFEDIRLATEILLSSSEKDWLKTLLIEHIIEKFNLIFSENNKIENLRNQLMRIKENLLLLFNNTFVTEYIDKISQNIYSNSNSLLPNYQKISEEKFLCIVDLMTKVSVTKQSLNQLFDASLSVWDTILHEIEFSQFFTIEMTKVGINVSEADAEKALLLLNRIRRELGIENHDIVIQFFSKYL